jgi:hypothetical protein
MPRSPLLRLFVLGGQELELLGKSQPLLGDAMIDHPSHLFAAKHAPTQQLAEAAKGARGRYAERYMNNAAKELDGYSRVLGGDNKAKVKLAALPTGPSFPVKAWEPPTLAEELKDAREHNQELDSYKNVLGDMPGSKASKKKPVRADDELASYNNVLGDMPGATASEKKTVPVRDHSNVISFSKDAKSAKKTVPVRDHHGMLSFPPEKSLSKAERAKQTLDAAKAAVKVEGPMMEEQLGSYDILDFPPTQSHVKAQKESTEASSEVKRKIAERLAHYNAFEFPGTTQHSNPSLARNIKDQDKDVAAQLASYNLLSFPPVEQHAATKPAAKPVADKAPAHKPEIAVLQDAFQAADEEEAKTAVAAASAKFAPTVELAEVSSSGLGGIARTQSLAAEAEPARSKECNRCLSQWSVEALSCAEAHCVRGVLSDFDKEQLMINFQVGAVLAHYMGPQDAADTHTSVLIAKFVEPWSPELLSKSVPTWWTAKESQKLDQWSDMVHTGQAASVQNLHYEGTHVLVGQTLYAAGDPAGARKTFAEAMEPMMKRQRALNYLRKKAAEDFGHGQPAAKAIEEANEGLVHSAALTWRAPTGPDRVDGAILHRLAEKAKAALAARRAQWEKTKARAHEERALSTEEAKRAAAEVKPRAAQAGHRIDGGRAAEEARLRKELQSTKAQLARTKAQLSSEEHAHLKPAAAAQPKPVATTQSKPAAAAKASLDKDPKVDALEKEAAALKSQVAAKEAAAAKDPAAKDPVVLSLEKQAAELRARLEAKRKAQRAADAARAMREKGLENTLAEKEKLLREVQGNYTPLKKRLAQGMKRADTSLERALAADEAKLAEVQRSRAELSARAKVASVTAKERALEAKHAKLEATVGELEKHVDARAPAARRDARGDLNVQLSRRDDLLRTIAQLRERLTHREAKFGKEAHSVPSEFQAAPAGSDQMLAQLPARSAKLSEMEKATEAEQLAEAEQLIARAQALATQLEAHKLETRVEHASQGIHRRLSEVSKVLHARAAIILEDGTVAATEEGRRTALHLLHEAEKAAEFVHRQARWGGRSDAAALEQDLKGLAPLVDPVDAAADESAAPPPAMHRAAEQQAEQAAEQRERVARDAAAVEAKVQAEESAKQTLEARLRGAIKALKARRAAARAAAGTPVGAALDPLEQAYVRDEQALYKSGDFLPPLAPKLPAAVVGKDAAAEQAQDALVQAGEAGTTGGVDSESQLLRNDVSALVSATKVADPEQYDAMLQAAIHRNEQQLSKFGKAQRVASKAIDSSLSGADGVFSDSGAAGTTAMGSDAVREAIASAKRIEKDMHIVFAKPLSHDEAKAKAERAARAAAAKRATEIRKGEYVPGIGRVHSEGRDSLERELWDHHRVPAATAEAIAGQVVPIASARGLHPARLDDSGEFIGAHAARVKTNTRQPSGWQVAAHELKQGESLGSELGKLVSSIGGDKQVRAPAPAAKPHGDAGSGYSLWALV